MLTVKGAGKFAEIGDIAAPTCKNYMKFGGEPSVGDISPKTTVVFAG
jgi:hypothetical protein